MGALAATHVYLARRGADRKLRFGYELVLPIVIGGLPGVALYYVLARNERLDAGDQS
jgi:hypothetical protein